VGAHQYSGRVHYGIFLKKNAEAIVYLFSSGVFRMRIEARHLRMNRMAMTSRFVSVAAFGLLGAFTAGASPIFVSNFSFETIPGLSLPNGGCGTGCSYSTGAIPDWTGSNGTSGQFRPGTGVGNTAFFSTIPDGTTIAFSNQASPISQTVVPTVALGVTYTLMVDLGRRSDPGFTTFRSGADLLIGPVVGGQHFVATGSTPSPGTFSVFTATYTGVLGDVGKSITIELLSSGLEANFDDVVLSDSTTSAPEPAGITLFGLGLVGLLAFARRKQFR
jgi:hypothetical protein